MNEEKSSNVSEKDKKNKDKKEKFKILKVIKILLKYARCFGIVNIFLILSDCIINVFNKYILRKTSVMFSKKPSQNVQDGLIIFSLLVLLKLLFFCPISQNCYILWLVSILIIWRLAEILVYQLSIIFLSEENGIAITNFPRSIALFLINVSEVISIYAILYLSYGAIVYNNDTEAIKKPFEALYFSFITISTTGFGDIIPINGCGRILVFSEIAIGILLLVIFFGILISRFKSKSKDDRFYQLFKKFVTNRKKMKP